jgi:hypothetical protein
MNCSRLGLAALGGTVRAFCLRFLSVVACCQFLIHESRKYPPVYRTKEDMRTVRSIGIVATFIAILVVAIIFATIHQGGSDTTEGTRFGVLIGIFAGCAFVLHNYVNLNIELKLPGTGCGLRCPVDHHRNSHRSYLQNPSRHHNDSRHEGAFLTEVDKAVCVSSYPAGFDGISDIRGT